MDTETRLPMVAHEEEEPTNLFYTSRPITKLLHAVGALSLLGLLAGLQALFVPSHSNSSFIKPVRHLEQWQQTTKTQKPGYGSHYVTVHLTGHQVMHLPIYLDTDLTFLPCDDETKISPRKIHSCPHQCVYPNATCLQNHQCLVTFDDDTDTYRGREVQDTLTMQLSPTQTVRSSSSTTFACTNRTSGGMVGLAPGPNSVLSSLGHSTSSTLHLCFIDYNRMVPAGTSAGSVSLGGVDVLSYVPPLLLWAAQAPTDGYAVHVRRVYLSLGVQNDEALLLEHLHQGTVGLLPLDAQNANANTYEYLDGSRGVAVGISNRHATTVLHWSLEPAFRRVWAQAMPSIEFPSSYGSPLTRQEFQALPTIVLQLEALHPRQSTAPVPGNAGHHDATHPYDILLAIPPRHYLQYDDYQEMATPTLAFGDVSRLGTNLLRGRELVFSDKGVGFAQRPDCPPGLSFVPPEDANMNQGISISSLRGGAASPPMEVSAELLLKNNDKDPMVVLGRGGRPAVVEGGESIARTIIQSDPANYFQAPASAEEGTVLVPGFQGDPQSGEKTGSLDRTVDTAPPPLQAGGEATTTSEQAEAVPVGTGLPQALRDDGPPVFRAGPGAVPAKEALGSVEGTVQGNGFWSLTGFAAFLFGFFLVAVATQDERSHSRERRPAFLRDDQDELTVNKSHWVKSGGTVARTKSGATVAMTVATELDDQTRYSRSTRKTSRSYWSY